MMKMNMVTQTVTMKRSHWARATGPSLIMVDWGPLRLNTWCSLLQPGSTTRARAAASAAPTREMGRKAERVRIMCNSGGISGVRDAKCIGAGFGIFKAFQSQNRDRNSLSSVLLISLHHALGGGLSVFAPLHRPGPCALVPDHEKIPRFLVGRRRTRPDRLRQEG